MKKCFLGAVFMLCPVLCCVAQRADSSVRHLAEYYVAAYAKHYNLPVAFVRAIVQVESDWRPCPISSKGAVGLMQLMPLTAARLGVRDRCDINANISGGVRYLAWLRQRLGGDLRLTTAAYLAGEEAIARRGLLYSNPEVFAYVSRVRQNYELEMRKITAITPAETKGTVR